MNVRLSQIPMETGGSCECKVQLACVWNSESATGQCEGVFATIKSIFNFKKYRCGFNTMRCPRNSL